MPIFTLSDFVMANTNIIAPGTLDESLEEGWASVDMVFERIECDTGANATQFEQLIREQRPTYQFALDILDGKFHNYIDIGNWLGDQKTALRLLALGGALGTFMLIRPSDVLDISTHSAALAFATIGLLGEVREK